MSAAYRDERLALQASNGRLREQLLQQRQRIHAAAARRAELLEEQAPIDRQREAAEEHNGASTQAEPFGTLASAPRWRSALGWVAGPLVVFLASAWFAPVAHATLLESPSYRRVPSNAAPLRSSHDDNAGRHQRCDLDNLETAATYGVFPSGLVLEVWVSESSKTEHEGDGVRVGGSRGEKVALRRGADELQRLAAALDKCWPQPADRGADDSR